MRQAGTLSNREQAQRLADYLLTQGISTRVEPEGEAWAIWARDEDQLPQATRELQQFLADPTAERYRQAGQAAESLRKQQARDDLQRQKNFIEVRNRWDARPVGRKPLTVFLIAASVFVALSTDLGENRKSEVFRAMLFSPPPPENFLDQFSWTPTKAIESGQIWRLVTPIFIHFGPMHLVFNMYWLYLFGSLIEIRRGTLRFGALVLVLAVASNYAQFYIPSHFHWAGQPSIMFGGMSGVGYGLFGYLWMQSRFDPRSQLFLPPNTVLMFLIWLVVCWTGLIGPVANWAHGVGLAVGAAIGYLPVAWSKLTK